MTSFRNSYLFLLFLIFVGSCGQVEDENALNYLSLEGETMGTSYHVTYSDSLRRDFQREY